MENEETKIVEYDDTFIEIVVERNVLERVRCERRGDEVVFIFDMGGDSKSIVKADVYIEVLNKLMENPLESHYGVRNENI